MHAGRTAKGGLLIMEQFNLYAEFERVFTDSDHQRREIDTEKQHTPRNAEPKAIRRSAPGVSSYARRVLALLCKPQEQWDAEDRAFAARAIEDARYAPDPADQETFRSAGMSVSLKPKQRPIRDEFDRRLWGVPPRPYLSSP